MTKTAPEPHERGLYGVLDLLAIAGADVGRGLVQPHVREDRRWRRTMHSFSVQLRNDRPRRCEKSSRDLQRREPLGQGIRMAVAGSANVAFSVAGS